MNGYRHILLAVDFNEGTERVADRALSLGQLYQAQMSLLHVVEPVPVEAGGEAITPPSMYLERDYVNEAERRLSHLADRLGLDDSAREIRLGHTKREILTMAEERAADLIVVGSHGRHGLALLLGSTANAVLHGAPCDVLAVRI